MKKGKQKSFLGLLSFLVLVGIICGKTQYIYAYTVEQEQVFITNKTLPLEEFMEKLKENDLMPEYIIDCFEANKGYMNGIYLVQDMRGTELLRYEYMNVENRFQEQSMPITEAEAVEKSIRFIKTFSIGTPDLVKVLNSNISMEEKISKMHLKSTPLLFENAPNYRILEITLQFSEKDNFRFLVDMNMGGVISFENKYQEKLSKNDIFVFYGSIRIPDGKKYFDQLKEDEVGLWTDERGHVIHYYSTGSTDTKITLSSKDALIALAKEAKQPIYIPMSASVNEKLDFEKIEVEFYLTPENVMYDKPTKTIHVQDNINFNIYKLNGDYKRNIKSITIGDLTKKNDYIYAYHINDGYRSAYNQYQSFFVENEDGVQEAENRRSLHNWFATMEDPTAKRLGFEKAFGGYILGAYCIINKKTIEPVTTWDIQRDNEMVTQKSSTVLEQIDINLYGVPPTEWNKKDLDKIQVEMMEIYNSIQQVNE